MSLMSRRSQINLVISPRLLWEADCLRSADREGNENDKICKRKKKKQGIRAFSSFVVICPLLVLRVVDAGRRAGDPLITSGFLFLPCVTIQHCPQSCFPAAFFFSPSALPCNVRHCSGFLAFSFYIYPFLAIAFDSERSLFALVPFLSFIFCAMSTRRGGQVPHLTSESPESGSWEPDYPRSGHSR